MLLKAQSAMEYLMTYGWAILIIAIVLAALFSLGIFSSSSLVGTTCVASSGFLCSGPIAYGTTFTATVGQSTGTNWNNVVLCFVPDSSVPSSCAGYPSVDVGALNNGQSGTFSFNVISASTTASGVIWAQYDELSYTGLMSQIATVTMKGLTPSGATTTIPTTSVTSTTTSTSTTTIPAGPTLPTGITYYANVIITNSQTSNAPSPFQQMVQIPESTYSGYIAYNGMSANFEFFTSDGSIIPAWIESNSSGTITAWLNLPNGIPASNSIDLYIGFASPATNLLSSSGTTGIGEAPQLSPTYGEYDDGASVFNFYDNFAGTSLNTSKWTSGTDSGGTVTVNNGLTLTYNSGSAGGGWVASKYTFTQSSNLIWETNFNLYGTSNFNDVRVRFYFWNSAVAVTGDQNANCWLWLVNSEDYGYYTSSNIGANIADAMLPYGTVLGTLPTPSSSTNYDALSQQILTTSGFTFNTYSFPSYSSVGSATQSGSNSDTFQVVLEASDDGSSGNNVQVNVDWTRTRAYPPNGVMPSVSFGAVS